MTNILSRARYEDESNMVLRDEDDDLKYFKTSQASVTKERGLLDLNAFSKSEYEGEWLHIRSS